MWKLGHCNMNSVFKLLMSNSYYDAECFQNEKQNRQEKAGKVMRTTAEDLKAVFSLIGKEK